MESLTTVNVVTDKDARFRVICLDRKAEQVFALLQLAKLEWMHSGLPNHRHYSRQLKAARVRKIAQEHGIELFSASREELVLLKRVRVLLPRGPSATLVALKDLAFLVHASSGHSVVSVSSAGRENEGRSVLPHAVAPLLPSPQLAVDTDAPARDSVIGMWSSCTTLDSTGVGFDGLDPEDYYLAETALLSRLSAHRGSATLSLEAREYLNKV